MEILVGTGGWDYFNTNERDKLKAYSRNFRFVEVNSTFYHMPRLKTARSWRKRVPEDFVFSVKCNRSATHECNLMPIEKTFNTLEKMAMICRLLRSKMLVIQTPPRLKIDRTKVVEVSNMLKNTNMSNFQVFWEARTPWTTKESDEVKEEMIKNGITPVIDLVREQPIFGSKIIYSRLFSYGEMKLRDHQIVQIGKKVSESKAERVVLTFHGTSMYNDAARFQKYTKAK